MNTNLFKPKPSKLQRWLMSALACILILPVFHSPAQAQTDIVEDLLNSAGIGGTRGYRLQRIGANNTVGSLNAGTNHYPASSIKVLQHYFAMTKVEDGDWSLMGTNLDVCSNQSNCGATPNDNVNSCNAVSQNLSTVLSGMMLNSNNPQSNAVQEQVGFDFYPSLPPFTTDPSTYGRGMMTSFAQNTIGANNTELNHKFSCGGPCANGVNPNVWTLNDAALIYRSIGTSSLLSMPNRIAMKDLMLNENQAFIQNVIDQEAADVGKAVHIPAFKAKMYQIFKGGDWTCNGTAYISLNGMIQLPTYNGAYKRIYTWGVMLDATQAAFLNQATFQAAAEELLRPVIRGALLTWSLPYEGTLTLGDIADDIESHMKGYSKTSTAYGFMDDAVQSLRLAAQLVSNGAERFYERAFTALFAADDKLHALRTLQGRGFGLAGEQKDLVEAHLGLIKDMRAYLISTGDDPDIDDNLQTIAQYQKDSQAAQASKRAGLVKFPPKWKIEKASFDIDWSMTNITLGDASQGYVPSTGSKTAGPADNLSPEFQAGPNPFRENVGFNLRGNQDGYVSLKVYDLNGRMVADLINQNLEEGEVTEVNWQANALPNGIYLARLTTPEGVKTMKLIKQR